MVIHRKSEREWGFKTWYSNARWREGRKRSNSKYWRVL